MHLIHILLVTIFGKLISCLYLYRDDDEVHYHGKHDGSEVSRGFLNEWVVHIDGGDTMAQLLAAKMGYFYGGEVMGFPGKYVFYNYDHQKERRTPSTQHTNRLNSDHRIRFAEQLFIKNRVKRSLDSNSILTRVKRLEETENEQKVVEHDDKTNHLFNDELWSDEWYLQSNQNRRSISPSLDLNVLPVYAMGVNGSGVRVSVLDDGIEYNHTDLAANYDPEISWDCNDRDPDPMPENNDNKNNSHGTRCAGEIAMIANNKKCGVGVAWGAKVGGVRMLDGHITDRIEGEAIGFAWDKVDIYSASWGPDDNGRTVEGPGKLALEALKRGVTKGRNGKGVIYIWANGNGGGNQDNCNCDGYSSSIYTISIGSASQRGLFPWYGEVCSSTLASAYSSGAHKEQKVATTDVWNSCTLRHTGTSAAAPLAAGVIALTLSANPNLTWRDVQHLIVWTSEYEPLIGNPGWKVNGIGLMYNIRFGFGLLNARALVASALNWTSVPPKLVCKIKSALFSTKTATLSPNQPLEIMFSVDDCIVNHLEHVELFVSAKHSNRGALEIDLISPQGTKVNVLSVRPKDTSKEGFTNWPFVSVATWGENPKGLWVAIFRNKSDELTENNGHVDSTWLVLHGTREIPEHMKYGPRKYNYGNEYSEIIDDMDRRYSGSNGIMNIIDVFQHELFKIRNKLLSNHYYN